MQIRSIAVLGIGQMGSAAAVCFARAGYRVLVWARHPEKLGSLPAALDAMGRFLDEHVGRAASNTLDVELTSDLARVNDQADFVLECIAEDLGQKAELLRQFEPAATRGAVLASCTSGLSISEMGRKSGMGHQLVGAHFWNPPHLMPLVEVVRGDETDEALVAATAELMRRIGKIPVICRDVPGFVGNRLQHALWREAIHLIQEGVCSAADVDLVARLTFALRLPSIGPCENMDLVGLELLSQIQSYLLADLSDAKDTMPLVQQMLDNGLLGMKSGRGLYDWSARDAAELADVRNRQIVNQLRFLQANNRLTGPLV
jgi:3-hydroxybutyryl-CoA dehydrogenase